ncbi:MAG: hypothetical protein ABJF67_13010 [Aurantimonas coralicida]
MTVQKKAEQKRVVKCNPANDFRKAVNREGATYEISHDTMSYSNYMQIKFADGTELHMRHFPGEWSDDLYTLEAFVADRKSKSFAEVVPGQYVTCG